MSLRLKPYPAYKDSTEYWLGAIPSVWGLVPAFAAFRERQEKNVGLQENQVLSLSYGRIVKKHENALHGLVPASFETYQIVEPGNLILRLTDLQNDQRSLRVGLAADRGIITSAYLCLSVGNRLLPEFAYYLLHAADVQKAFYGMGSGLRQSMGFPELRRVPIPVPPIEEQTRIAAFLQMTVANIERLIRAKRRMIELLNEQKQAIIHRAVTRGLDPNVRLKNSGVEWLGEVPAHWDIGSLRRYAAKWCDGPFGSGLKSTHYVSEGVRVIRLTNIGSGEFRDHDKAFISEEHYGILGDHTVCAGDLLIAGLGDERIPAGRACVAPDSLGPAMVKADSFRFRLKREAVLPVFMALHLTGTASAATAALSTGATRQRINLSTTAARSVAVPPLREQQEIVQYLQQLQVPIQKAVESALEEIKLLREYRTRLIADVVTGKLDVRGVELPEFDAGEVDEPLSDVGGEELEDEGELVVAGEAADAD